MPQNFGDVFVQSYAGGVKLENEMQQHAQDVAVEEEKIAATRAIEAARSEQLSKQIENEQKFQAAQMTHMYETDYQAKKTAFSTSMLGVDPNNKYVKQLHLPIYTAEQAGKFFGIEATPGTFYTDAQWGPAIVGAEQIDRQLAAQQAAIDKANAPIVEADTLNAEFDKRSLPSTTVKKDVETMPSFYNGMTNAIDQTINLLPGIHLQSVKSPLGDGNLEVPWIGYTKQQEKTIPNYFKNIGEGFTKPGMEQREVSNVEGIKQYLDDQAKTMGKMIPRASGEHYPYYSRSIDMFTNIGENLLQRDAEGNPVYDNVGNPVLDTQGLSTTAASTLMNAMASQHKTQYLIALSEAEMDRKTLTATDPDKAQKLFAEAKLKAQKLYPLYNQSVGQVFGQRYAKQ